MADAVQSQNPSACKSTITAERLRELLSYDASTGYFSWRVKPSVWSSIEPGDLAGCLQRGYRKIKLDQKVYYAHRLAWLWVNGEYPRAQLDHINREPDDNRIVNLREVTGSQNRHNTLLTHLNTTGIKGVGWNQRDGNWTSRLRVDGKLVFFGYFADKLDATIAFNYNATFLLGEFVKINPVPFAGYAHD